MAHQQPPRRGEGVFHYLKMMAEEVQNYPPGSTFRKESLIGVFRKFQSVYGVMFSDRYLKYKFKQLKKRYKEMSEVLSEENVYWEKKTNVLSGNEKVLKTKYKSRYRSGRYYGEQHYELMCQIFESGVKFE